MQPSYTFSDSERDELHVLLGTVEKSPYDDYPAFSHAVADLVDRGEVPAILVDVTARIRNERGQGISSAHALRNCPRDWRDDPSFPLNLPEHQGATIVVAGSDFGTGSSRESAVWVLQAFGFVAVIAPRFGDIFLGNALTKGLLAVVVPADVVERLWRLIDDDPSLPVTIDIERLQVRFADDVVAFDLDEDARTRLRTGLDPIAATLRHAADIVTFEKARRAALPTTVH